MSIELQAPIDLHFSSENAYNLSAIVKSFDADVIVRDEGKTIMGVAAIKKWRIENAERYHHKVEPLSVSTQDGKVAVRGRVCGRFPGSPIELDHVFEIEGGKITALEIR
jgi:hypothetical protein